MPSPESLQPAERPAEPITEEPVIEMARSHPSRQEKSQSILREALEKRFDTLKAEISESLDRYDEMLTDGSFDDKEGEEKGAGDKRREQFQSRINSMLDKLENMKKTLDSKEPLPQSTPRIEASYTYTNPASGKVERQETITLDIEKKIDEFTSFYQKTGIDLPPDFAETILDIWENNSAEIQEAIQEQGFDDILIISATTNLVDLSKKMMMEKGYYDWIKSNSNVQNLGGIPFTSPSVDKPRLILVHKAQNLKDRPELNATFGIQGKDVKLDQALTLEDYIVFQRKYFDETTKHLDEDGWTWTSTKSGARLVYSRWDSDRGGLHVRARDLEDRDGRLGVRPSRSFF